MIRSSIMLMQPFPPSTKFSPFIHKEPQFTPPTEEDKFIAQLLKPFNKGNPGNLKPKLHLVVMVVVSRFSLTVKKTDYTIEVCFKKHGLPPYMKRANIANSTIVEDSGT